MSAAKRVRWECPTGEHAGVLASSRPRRNATARYCLPCSESAGVLVERVAPSLERKRNAKAAAVQMKAQAKRECEREAKALAHVVPVIDADGAEFTLDALKLLDEAWRTDELRSQQRDAWSTRRAAPVPELVIRRGSADAGRAARHSTGIRLRDTLSGHAAYDGSRIVLTARPGLGAEWLQAIVIHEAAHAACPIDSRHGPRWRSAYVRAVREVYPEAQIPPMPEIEHVPNWRLDEIIAEALLGSVTA